MPRPDPASIHPWAAALGAVGCAVALQLALPAVFDAYIPTLAYLAAVLVAARVGGRDPALLATGLSCIALLAPLMAGRSSHEPVVVAVGTGFFAVLGASVARLAGRLHAARARLAEERERLRRSHDFHSIIADLTADFAFTARVDADGTITTDAVTEGFARTTGYTLPELLAAGGWPVLIHADDLPRAHAQLTRALAGETIEGELRYVTRDGRVVWQRYRTRPSRDAAGRVARLYGAARDISRERDAEMALRDSEARFRAIVETTPGIVYVTGPRGAEFTSRSFSEYTGMSADDAAGMGWMRAVHPDDLATVETLTLPPGTATAPAEVRYRLRRHDGRYRWFLDRFRPILDAQGHVARWLGMAIDIHDLVTAEESLRAADRRKDEFLATLAHELRNPLAPIRNGLELLGHVETEAGGHAAARAMLERQLGQLVRLIDDLLDLSRITRDRLELRRERTTLRDVTTRAVETVRPLMAERGHELRVELPARDVPLWVDGARLAQVLANLLHNAAKYTDPGGHVTLRADAGDDTLTLDIADDGIGIAPDVLPLVFDMYRQAPASAERSLGGLGIGLTLVRRLVEMHGGSVAAASAGTGRGSRFTVRLPLAPVPAATAEDAPEALPAAVRRRVLIVDDNADAATSLGELLRLRGHEVRTAFDGRAALDEAARFAPEAAVVDLGMPEMDGCEVARRLRALPAGECTTIIALTGWGQDADRQRSREAGCDFHLVKPAHPDAIERLVTLPRA